jgi:hypothetical protein
MLFEPTRQTSSCCGYSCASDADETRTCDAGFHETGSGQTSGCWTTGEGRKTRSGRRERKEALVRTLEVW